MKKKNLSLTVSLLILVCNIINIQAQDSWSKVSVKELKDDLRFISDKMKALDSYTVNISYSSFEKDPIEIMHDHSVGYLKKNGKKLHSYVVGVHSIQDENERLEIDTLNDIIVIASPVSDEFQSISFDLTDYFFAKAKTIQRRVGNGARYYRILFDETMPISSYELELDNSYFIKKIEVVYNQKLKNDNDIDVNLCVRVEFNGWNIHPKFNEKEFDKNLYVIKRNNKFSLSDRYSRYKLLDQRVIN